VIKLVQILFFLVPLFGFSQKDTIAHLYTFGGNNNDNAEEIQATSDGGYIVIGSTSSNSWGNTDAYLLKVDSLCNYQWSKALGGNNNDWGYSIKQTFDKGYIIAVTSNSYGNGGYDAVLMKRDSLGNYEWTKVYGGIDWDFAYSVVQTYDSGYVFCGETYNNTNGFSDVYIVKTNPLGDTLWTRTYGGTLIDKGNSVIETSDSNIVVAGISNSLTDSTDIYVLKLTANGTLIWDSVYNQTKYESAASIIEANNGDYIVNGTTTSFSPSEDKDYYLMRLNDNGQVLWAYNYGNPSIPKDEEALAIYEDVSGNLINVGYTKAYGAGGSDAYLFYLSSSGGWLGISPTYGGTNDEVFNGFAIGTNGNFCMAGSTNSYGNGLDDIFLVRVDTIYAFQDTSIVKYFDVTPLNVSMVKNDVLEFNFYPNPVQDYLFIEIPELRTEENYVWSLFNVVGEKVTDINISSGVTSILLAKYSKQMYFFTLRELKSNKIIGSGKIIVN
jgi:hypothetical protein